MSEFTSDDATPPPVLPNRDESEIRSPHSGITAGDRIGAYKLLQRLGEGGMGEVWLAEQSQPVRRHVAVKLIRPGMDSQQVLARFEAERQALAMMDHPNIAKILDAGMTGTAESTSRPTSASRPFFVMELVKGIPITRYCDQEKLSPRERLELLIPVCQAVQHAHQKGIIHRDLKPSNVLVGLYDGQPVPKVIDFGVAKAAGARLTDQTLFTEVGAMIGTPEYMAPEQARLDNLDIDTRADVYSLGVLMYELLTGSLPFTRKQLTNAAFAEMLRLIREVEPPKPSTRLSSSEALPTLAAVRKLEPKRLTNLVRGELDWIVMKCLEKERGRRYATAIGLALDIERYLAEEPVSAGPPSAVYRMRKFARRHKGPVLAASLLMIALMGGVVGTTLAMQKARTERDQKEAALRRADEERAAALAVVNFLQNDLLKQASPWTQAATARSPAEAKQNPTVRELLDRAAAELTPDKIEQKFPGNPLVQAQILRSVGSTYRAVGDHGKAIMHLQRASELEKKQLGVDESVMNGSQMSLARSYMDAGQTREAIGLFEQIRDVCSANLGPTHATTLAALTNLATAYIDADRRTEALEISKKVRDAQLVQIGPDHPLTLTTLHNMAVLHTQLGHDADAIQLFEKVRDARAATIGIDHPDTLGTLMCLGAAYHNIGRLADAIALYRKLAPTLKDKMGADHPYTLRNDHALAMALHEDGQLPEATRIFERVSETWSAKLGNNHRLTLTAKQNLASTYLSAGRFADAIKLLEQVRDGQNVTLGPDHSETLSTLLSLGMAYQEAKRPADAIATLEQACAASIKKHGKEDQTTITAQQSLALAYQEAGRLPDAIALFEQVRDASVATLGADHSQTLSRATLLAKCYIEGGRFADAEPVLKNMIKTFDEKKIDKWSTYYVRSLLGAALLGQTKFAEAEPFLICGYDGMKQRRDAILPAHRTKYLTDGLGRLVKLYDQWNKPEQADKCRKELATLQPAASNQSP